MAIEVPLYCGRVALVDEVDADRVLRHRWHSSKLRPGTHVRYACSALGREDAKQIGRRHLRMHRYVLGYPDGIIDHINGNGLDNRRDNLRVVTHSENQANRRKRRPGTSQYKGVSWHKGSGAWQVYVCVDKRPKYVGTFKCEEDAATAYDDAARELWGDCALTNFGCPTLIS